MDDFKKFQIAHFIDNEGQKERIILALEKIINSLNKDIIKNIDPDLNNKSETLKNLNIIINTHYRKFSQKLKEELIELGLYESSFQTALIKKEKNIELKEETKGSNKELLLALLLGLSLDENIEEQKQTLKNNIKRNIGVIYNQSTSKTAAKNNIKTLLNRSNAQIKTIAATAVNNHINQTVFETLKKNGVKKYQYVAVLDNRTSKICKSLHNKIFFVSDKNAPKPPQHFRCRSSIIPVFDKNDEFTDNDTLKRFAELAGNKRNIDENGNFKLTKNDVISLKERIKRDKNFFNI